MLMINGDPEDPEPPDLEPEDPDGGNLSDLTSKKTTKL